MVTHAESLTARPAIERRRWRLRLWLAGIAFVVITGSAVTSTLWLAQVLREWTAPDATVADPALLSIADGPPRLFVFLDSDLVDDNLAQIVDRLPPPGSIATPRNVQVRSRRFLALLQALDERGQLKSMTRIKNWHAITPGTVIRAEARWPATTRVADADIHVPLSAASEVAIRTRDLAWRPRTGQHMTIIAQSLARPRTATAEVDLRPLALYPR
jgi:hypothetical protein